MLRKLSLLTLLLVGTVDVHAHELLLRGGADEEVATYNFEEEDVDKRVCKKYFLEVCCDGKCREGMVDYKSGDEVRDAKVCRNMCLNRGGRKCNWSWRAEGCRDPDKPKSSIKCTKPRASRIRKEGHSTVCDDLAPRDVPYKCEDGSKLCCTESGMKKVTFDNKGWGECRKTKGEEAISEA